jgi:hypothetical protein
MGCRAVTPRARPELLTRALTPTLALPLALTLALPLTRALPLTLTLMLGGRPERASLFGSGVDLQLVLPRVFGGRVLGGLPGMV